MFMVVLFSISLSLIWFHLMFGCVSIDYLLREFKWVWWIRRSVEKWYFLFNYYSQLISLFNQFCFKNSRYLIILSGIIRLCVPLFLTAHACYRHVIFSFCYWTKVTPQQLMSAVPNHAIFLPKTPFSILIFKKNLHSAMSLT